jgi:hypothetical protein
MAITLSGTDGITFNNSTVQASAGQVLQVVNAIYGTQVSNSTSTYTATGLTATITPKFSTSKVLILINHATCRKSAASANNYMGMFIQKNGSNLQQIIASGGYTGTAIDNYFTVSYVYLDSPATTSATTYSTTFANPNNTASVLVQGDGSISPSTITLMEIAA